MTDAEGVDFFNAGRTQAQEKRGWDVEGAWTARAIGTLLKPLDTFRGNRDFTWAMQEVNGKVDTLWFLDVAVGQLGYPLPLKFLYLQRNKQMRGMTIDRLLFSGKFSEEVLNELHDFQQNYSDGKCGLVVGFKGVRPLVVRTYVVPALPAPCAGRWACSVTLTHSAGWTVYVEDIPTFTEMICSVL